MDTVTISPGQTLDLIATFTNPGKWLLHCHIFGHSHKTDDTHSMSGATAGADATGMTGMVTIVDVSASGHDESALGLGRRLGRELGVDVVGGGRDHRRAGAGGRRSWVLPRLQALTERDWHTLMNLTRTHRPLTAGRKAGIIFLVLASVLLLLPTADEARAQQSIIPGVPLGEIDLPPLPTSADLSSLLGLLPLGLDLKRLDLLKGHGGTNGFERACSARCRSTCSTPRSRSPTSPARGSTAASPCSAGSRWPPSSSCPASRPRPRSSSAPRRGRTPTTRSRR